MIELFKITHGIYDEQVTSDVLPLQGTTRTRGHKYTMYKRSSRLDIRKFSFTFRTVDQWNNLPDHVVDAETVKAFESRLDKIWKGSDVIYNHKCDLIQLTSSRNTRYTNKCANPTNIETDEDLMSEA